MTNPIHADDSLQHVNVRIYFDKDLEHGELLDKISNALQTSADLCEMVSAYELVRDSFGQLVPADKPLA